MNEKKLVLTSSCVEISEHKDYLELENLVCYYNYPNANGTQLDYGKTKEEHAATLEKAKTLLLMPVYAKCAVNWKGQPTFKGHEVSYDKNGNVQFGTMPIGIHHKVRIKKADIVAADGTPQRLPCLFATQRVWKRNKNAVAAIRRLFSEGKLFNSWEVESEQYTFHQGTKHLEEYSFLGNTFLGYEYASPAYGTGGGAKVISVASQEKMPLNPLSESELIVAEALYQDSLERQNNGNEVSEAMLDNENFEVTIEETPVVETSAQEAEETENIEVETSEEVNEQEEELSFEVNMEAEVEEDPSEETPEVSQMEETEEEKSSVEAPVVAEIESEDEPQVAPETETSTDEPEVSENVDVSMLTTTDLRNAVDRAYRKFIGEDNYRDFWVSQMFPADSVAWIKEYGRHAKELDFVEVVYEAVGNEVVIVSATPVTLVASPREMNQLLSEKDEKIEKLTQENSELSEIKVKYEAEQAEKRKAEHEQEVANLRSYAKNSGYFTDEELESTEMSSLFEEVKSAEIKAMIADRAVAEKSRVEVDTSAAHGTVPSAVQTPRMELSFDNSAENAKKKRSSQWNAFIGK